MSDHRALVFKYVTESLENLHHYVNSCDASYQDLVNLQNAVDSLNLAIDTKLMRDFSHIPEIAKMLKIKD